MTRMKCFWRPRHLAVLMGTAVLTGAIVAGCGAPQPAEPEAPETAAQADAPADAMDTPAVAIEPPAAETDMPEDAEADAAAVDDGATVTLPPVTQTNSAAVAELLAAQKGKVVVLNIWATWCPPCVHEMPDLVKFYNETSRDEIAFISLSVDEVSEIDGAIPEFQKVHQVPFPIYVINDRDLEGLNASLKGEFKGAIPSTFVYGKDGALAETVLGEITREALQTLVAGL